jgi:CubicO group peptidase (beta-lactamase class C family)
LNRYFWAGALSTNFWIDPRNDLFAEIMTQVFPLNHGGADALLRQAVGSAIEK